ncbi:ATP-binding protein, partial [uncultured Ruminococcus sp.]|uniref:ATP-binding protein n=1 Tax=uncultured Ruminococcus sp. TaxID=165186 RepID=UPI002617A4E2
MLTENTITKLQEMRLSTMANAFREQLSDPNISELSFEDRFGLLVDKEWATRKNNHLTRLIKKANFADTGACVEDIAYDKARKLDKAQIVIISRLGKHQFATRKTVIR